MLPIVEASWNDRSLPRTFSRDFSDTGPSAAIRKAKYQTKQSRQQHKKNKHRSTRHNSNKHHLKKPEPKPRYYGKQQTTDATTLECKQPRSVSFGDLDGREKEARQKHKHKYLKKHKKKKHKHRDRHKGPSSHTTTRASPGEESLALDLAGVGMQTPTPTGLRSPGHRIINACMETTTPNPNPNPKTTTRTRGDRCNRIVSDRDSRNHSRPMSAIRERPSGPRPVVIGVARAKSTAVASGPRPVIIGVARAKSTAGSLQAMSAIRERRPSLSFQKAWIATKKSNESLENILSPTASISSISSKKQSSFSSVSSVSSISSKKQSSFSSCADDHCSSSDSDQIIELGTGDYEFGFLHDFQQSLNAKGSSDLADNWNRALPRTESAESMPSRMWATLRAAVRIRKRRKNDAQATAFAEAAATARDCETERITKQQESSSERDSSDDDAHGYSPPPDPAPASPHSPSPSMRMWAALRASVKMRSLRRTRSRGLHQIAADALRTARAFSADSPAGLTKRMRHYTEAVTQILAIKWQKQADKKLASSLSALSLELQQETSTLRNGDKDESKKVILAAVHRQRALERALVDAALTGPQHDADTEWLREMKRES